MALDLHEWLVQQRDPADDDYRVIFSEYEDIIPLTSTTGVMINSTDLDIEWLGHTIPADTIIYGDQSTSFSQVLSDIGEIDDIQLRLSSVDDFADLSAAPVDDVEFEWSSGNDDLRGTINDTKYLPTSLMKVKYYSCKPSYFYFANHRRNHNCSQ